MKDDFDNNKYNKAELKQKKLELNEYENKIKELRENRGKLFKEEKQSNRDFILDQNIFDSGFQQQQNNKHKFNSKLTNFLLQPQQNNPIEKKQNLDPFSFNFDITKNNSKNTNSNIEKPKLEIDNILIEDKHPDPIINKKLNALQSKNIQKAVSVTFANKTINQLKDEIILKNFHLREMKDQLNNYLKNDKNPSVLRGKYEDKINEKNYLQKELENKERDRINHENRIYQGKEIKIQMKNILASMNETQKKERYQLIQQIKKSDDQYFKLKSENESLLKKIKNSDNIIINENLVLEEFEKFKFNLDDQFEDDFMKGNDYVISLLKNYINKFRSNFNK